MRLLLIFLCFSAFLCTQNMKAGEHTADTTVCFDRSLLRMEHAEGGDGEVYIRMSYPNSRSLEKVGFPELPVFHVFVPLPSNAENIRVTAQARETERMLLDKTVYPVQYARFTDEESLEREFVRLDMQAFANSNLSKPAAISDVSNWDGTCKMVGVDLLPVSYDSQNDEYLFSKEIHVTLNYALPHSGKTGSKASTQTSPKIGLPYYRYCIITSRELEESFLRLAGWQKQKGMEAGILCVEDILSCEAIAGDTVSGLYDEAGKVRQYLQYAYKYGGTEYVLFGGDSNVLPIRYGESNGDDIWAIDANQLHIPTDFYFSELTSNWKRDGDDVYGEFEDITEYRSQLKVGRLLCNTAEEVDNYTDKLLRYEINPGNGDEDYLKRIFLTQADEMQVDNQAEKLASAISDVYPEQTIVSCGNGKDTTDMTDYTGTEIVNMMKERYGYVSWLNHGSPTAICVKNWKDTSHPHYGVTASSGDSTVVVETGNGLEKLDNKDYPMIAYTMACSTTPFDGYDENYANRLILGKSFTTGKDYGGPAYIGNTRVGLIDNTYKVQLNFNREIIDNDVAYALNTAKYFNLSCRHHNALVVNLIGVPNLYVWTETPKRFNAWMEYNDMSADLFTESDVNDACWCTWRLNETGDSISCDAFNPSFTQSTLTDIENGVITLTGRNCIPQVMPLRLHNVRLHGKRHLFLCDALIGEDYRNEYDIPVVFASDSKTTMEHEGTIKFDKNVVIEKGATLKIIPSKIKQ